MPGGLRRRDTRKEQPNNGQSDWSPSRAHDVDLPKPAAVSDLFGVYRHLRTPASTVRARTLRCRHSNPANATDYTIHAGAQQAAREGTFQLGRAALQGSRAQQRVDLQAGVTIDKADTMNMAPPLDDEPVEFQQDRLKISGRGAAALALVAMGAWSLAHHDLARSPGRSPAFAQLADWAATIFFSLCLLAILASLVRPATVRLSSEGIQISYAWGTYRRTWDNVGGFELWRYRGDRTVIYNDVRPTNPVLAKINHWLTGATSALPTALNVDPERLLTVIECARAKWQPRATATSFTN